MKKLLFILLCLLVIKGKSQNTSTSDITSYTFIIQDSPSKLYSMRQFNQNYLSCYRLSNRVMDDALRNKNLSSSIQLLLLSFFLTPLTHEEGHRSILTHLKIGSISQPYFNSSGAAYVNGVTDSTLQNLRNTQLPNYIRLHTGGLESDYMLTKHLESIFVFNQDNYQYYKWEYLIRKLGILSYYVPGIFRFEIDLDEEPDELDRDIVGHDIYGAARHLFRPNMDFYRYTKYKDLTKHEIKYVERLGYRSFLNLLTPILFRDRLHFHIADSIPLSLGMGHSMSPFGDFIDENIWVKFKTINIGFYARQFQNKKNWFNSFGLRVVDYQLNNRISSSFSGHYWNQPKDYDFNTSDYFIGGGVDLDLQYLFINNQNTWLHSYSINLGMIYKTKGFLPEELNLNKHFGLRVGTTIRM